MPSKTLADPNLVGSRHSYQVRRMSPLMFAMDDDISSASSTVDHFSSYQHPEMSAAQDPIVTRPFSMAESPGNVSISGFTSPLPQNVSGPFGGLDSPTLPASPTYHPLSLLISARHPENVSGLGPASPEFPASPSYSLVSPSLYSEHPEDMPDLDPTSPLPGISPVLLAEGRDNISNMGPASPLLHNPTNRPISLGSPNSSESPNYVPVSPVGRSTVPENAFDSAVVPGLTAGNVTHTSFRLPWAPLRQTQSAPSLTCTPAGTIRNRISRSGGLENDDLPIETNAEYVTRARMEAAGVAGDISEMGPGFGLPLRCPSHQHSQYLSYHMGQAYDPHGVPQLEESDHSLNEDLELGFETPGYHTIPTNRVASRRPQQQYLPSALALLGPHRSMTLPDMGNSLLSLSSFQGNVAGRSTPPVTSPAQNVENSQNSRYMAPINTTASLTENTSPQPLFHGDIGPSQGLVQHSFNSWRLPHRHEGNSLLGTRGNIDGRHTQGVASHPTRVFLDNTHSAENNMPPQGMVPNPMISSAREKWNIINSQSEEGDHMMHGFEETDGGSDDGRVTDTPDDNDMGTDGAANAGFYNETKGGSDDDTGVKSDEADSQSDDDITRPPGRFIVTILDTRSGQTIVMQVPPTMTPLIAYVPAGQDLF